MSALYICNIRKQPSTQEQAMADVNRGNRPLSPFMIGPYYKAQITSISSIMVRITGIAVLGLSLVIVAWLVAASMSEAAFNALNWVVQSIIGDVVLLGGVWALTYHFLGRLRHVIWDFGYCWDVPTSEKMGYGMFAMATLVTIATAALFVVF
ncbi:MAG: succinate dehydrogenase, cytochrome b556 subunit [Pseudomonadota bacterium]